MDFQLILYIIIVVVWLVLDNYRRIKKKQEYKESTSTTGTPHRQPGEKPYTSLEDILREFGMAEEKEVVVERKPRQVKKQERQKPAPVQYETYESSINKDYKFSSEKVKSEIMPLRIGTDEIKKTEIKDESAESMRKNNSDFDLRRAIIWSEILKRPYA